MPTYRDAIEKARAYAAAKVPLKHPPNSPPLPTKGTCPHCNQKRHVLYITSCGVMICHTCIEKLKFAYGASWESHVEAAVALAKQHFELKAARKELRAARR